MSVTLDLMEYSSDSSAQAAYVTDAFIYGSDVLTGGTPTALADYPPSYDLAKVVDNN